MGGGKAEAEARNAMKRTAEEDADGAVRRPPKDEEADMKVRTTQLQCLTHPLFSFHVSLHYTFFSPPMRRNLSMDIHRDGLNRRERSIFAVYVLMGGSWRSLEIMTVRADDNRTFPHQREPVSEYPSRSRTRIY
jgi:hypothetical protein